jgi:replicative DNA helicase
MKLDLEIEALKGLAGEATLGVDRAVSVLDELGVQAEDFQRADARTLFAAMAATLRGGRPLDALALMRMVGTSVSRQAVADVITDGHLQAARPRLGLVHEAGVRRRSILALEVLVRGLKDPTSNLAGTLTQAKELLTAFVAPAAGVRTMEADVMAFLDTLDRIQKGQHEPVVRTGIEALDYAVGGLQRTLTVVGARPRVGKSALIATIVHNLIARGERVGVLSLEDTRGWIVRRLVALTSSVSLFRLATRPLGKSEQERVQEAMGPIYNQARHLVCDDTAGMNTTEVVASARRMVAMGCRAVLVDHLGQIRLERSDRHDLDIAEALSALRDLAKTYGVPMVVATHLKRRDNIADDEAPNIQDFAFSAGVERMARVALGLYGAPGSDVMSVAVLKQTEGPSGFAFDLNRAKTAGMIAATPIPPSLRDVIEGAS